MTKTGLRVLPQKIGKHSFLKLWMMACVLLFQQYITGCRKPIDEPSPSQVIQEMDPDVRQLQQHTQAGSSRAFLQKAEAVYGTADWNNALVMKRAGEVVVWLPLLNLTRQRVEAILVCQVDAHLRIKMIEAPALSPATDGTAAQSSRVFGLFSYLIWNRQPLALQGINFRSFNRHRTLAHPDSRAVGWEVTTCYEWVACTGDGYGNCTGNITLHSECTTDVFWAKSWDYIDYSDGYGNQDTGGGGPTTEGQDPNLLPVPRTPIENLEKYLACFNRKAPAKLILYADQPAAGSDEPFTILGKMGHVFLAIEQQIDGQLFRRNFGFHPAKAINPFNQTSSESILGNDEYRPYDVQLTLPLDGAHLSEVINMIFQFQAIYDLENYNCVDFVLDVAQAGGLSLPRTKGWWIFGRGRNPGSFGEDLRRQADAVTDPGLAASNLGDCQ